MSYRIPRGYAVRHPQYQEIMEGQRPTLKDLRAAPYLPVAEIEPRQDDPIVIPAGTFVGVVTDEFTEADLRDTGVLNKRYRYLVPACGSPYTVTYSANDFSTTFNTNGFVKNIDTYMQTPGTGAAVTAAGASTKKVGVTNEGVKPLGITYQDIYAGWLGDAHINYERQPNISFLTRDQVIQLPAMTTQEQAIRPGDLVMVDGFGETTLTWNPSAHPSSTQRVGRLAAVTNLTGASVTGATSSALTALRVTEHIVGRCLRKIKVANYASATAGDSLSASVANDAFTRSNVNVEFQDAGRVQTVPGLSLQGSGIKGVPAWARYATADANKDFWLLEILLSTY